MRRARRKQINRRVAWVLFLAAIFGAYHCFGQESDSFDEVYNAAIKESVLLQTDAVLNGSFVGLNEDSRFKNYDMTQIEMTGNITAVEKNAFTVEWKELRNIANDRAANLPVAMMTTDKAGGNTVEQDKVVSVVGAKNQLMTVLPFLFDTPVSSSSVSAESNDAVSVLPVAGDSGSDTDEKEHYDSSAIDVNEKPEDEIAFTLEGCPIRIDWENNLVYAQNEVVKSVNGTEVERQGCQDADFPVEILRSYAECKDDVSLSEMTAFKMYKPYFLDKGEQTFLKDCTRDTELSYPIKESLSCTPLIDLKNKTVKELSLLFYTDDTARDVTVSDCRLRDTTRTFDLQFTYDTCSYRLDSEDGIAYQQGKYFFEKDGQSIDVSTCQDSELTYDIKNEFCFYKENMTSKKMLRYELQKLNTVNGTVYITDCQPVSQTDIIETADGCDGLHTDDFKGGFSYGWSRYYYVDAGNKQKFITDCAVSAKTYAHQAVVEDWQVDFDSLKATSLIAYYIDLPSGRIKISDAAITKDSIAVPLAKQTEEIIGTGELSYDGCLENEKQQRKTGYLLPNGETAYQFVDLAEPKSRYVCKDEAQTAGVGVYTGSYKKRPKKYKSHAIYHNIGAFYYRRTKSYNPATKQYICSPWQYTGQSIGSSKSSCPTAACWGPVCQGIQYDAGGGECVNNTVQPNLPCE